MTVVDFSSSSSRICSSIQLCKTVSCDHDQIAHNWGCLAGVIERRPDVCLVRYRLFAKMCMLQIAHGFYVIEMYST